MISLFLQEIKDVFTRENFLLLQRGFNEEPLLKGNFKFFTYTFDSAVSGFEVPHRLGFIPKDVLLLSATNSATVTFDYQAFSTTTIKVTTSASTTIRAFLGRYED